MALARRRQGPTACGLPPLLYLTDRARHPDPLAVAARLPPGSGVVLRDYGARDRPALARALATLCRRRRLVLLVGGDAALARAVKADGVHWRAADLARPAAMRRSARAGLRLVTAAAHDARELARAALAGADAVLLGSVFPTRSHEDARPLGPWRFAALARGRRFPESDGPQIYALGGIDPSAAARLPSTERFGGFAAIGALAD